MFSRWGHSTPQKSNPKNGGRVSYRQRSFWASRLVCVTTGISPAPWPPSPPTHAVSLASGAFHTSITEPSAVEASAANRGSISCRSRRKSAALIAWGASACRSSASRTCSRGCGALMRGVSSAWPGLLMEASERSGGRGEVEGGRSVAVSQSRRRGKRPARWHVCALRMEPTARRYHTARPQRASFRSASRRSRKKRGSASALATCTQNFFCVKDSVQAGAMAIVSIEDGADGEAIRHGKVSLEASVRSLGMREKRGQRIGVRCLHTEGFFVWKTLFSDGCCEQEG